MSSIFIIISPLLLLASLGYFWIRLAVKVSGWDDLAEQYFWPAPFKGTRWSRQTLHFSFGLLLWRSVTIKVNATGVFLEPLFPYAHVAPPIRIPWADLKVSRSGVLRCITLPTVRMRISPKLLLRILECRTEYEAPQS